MVDKIQALMAHPGHPLILVFPIGLLTLTMAGDLAFILTQAPAALQVLFWSSVIGLVVGLLAMLPVIIDYLTVVRGTRAEAITVMHMFFHGSAMICFVVATALLAYTGLSLSFFTFALHVFGFNMLLLGAVFATEIMSRRLFAASELQKLSSPERDEALVG